VAQHVTLIFGTLTPTGFELTENLIRKTVGAWPMSEKNQTSEPQVQKTGEGQLKRRLLVTNDNIIRVPKPLVKWRLPLIYRVEDIERNGDRVTITIRVVKEGDVNE